MGADDQFELDKSEDALDLQMAQTAYQEFMEDPELLSHEDAWNRINDKKNAV